MYPSTRYHPHKDPVVVKDRAEEKALGPGWYSSPAEFGVETCPGKEPDPAIAAKKSALSRIKQANSAAHPKTAFAALKQRFFK